MGATRRMVEGAKFHGERRQVRIVAMLAAMMMVVAACGSDDTEEPENDVEVEEPAEEPAEEPSEEEAADGAAEEASATPDSCVDTDRITLVHGHSPAGGYDAYTRLLAPFLGETLGVDVVVENEGGAGGLVALNTTYNADPDGTRIQVLNGPGTANAFLSDDPNTEGLDMGEIVYLGQLSGEPMTVYVAADSEFETFDDMLASERPVRFGSSGPGSADWAPPRIFERAFDMNLEMITGFDTAEIVTAILRGEVDAIVSTIDSRREQAENGDFRPLVLQATERTDADWFVELFGEDVPTQLEYADQTDDEGVALLETNARVTELGRVLITTPGTPDAVVDCLRDAVEETLTNEEFLAEAEEQGRPITFVPGSEYQDNVLTILENAPDSYGEILGD